MIHNKEALMASSTSSSGGKGASATQDKQQATDTALKNERGQTAGSNKTAVADDAERYGGTEPLPYPEPEPKDSITYRDPRPLDWPQKADRSVFVGPVHQLDQEKDVKGDYVDNAGLLDQDELELGGDAIEDAQVIAGGGQLTLILNGKAYVLGALGGNIQADLQTALQLNANS